MSKIYPFENKTKNKEPRLYYVSGVASNNPDRHKILDAKLKESIKKICKDRNLSSWMNNTKWSKLQNSISDLPFPPAYNIKLLNHASFEYNCCWDDDDLKPFYLIEWLCIKPTCREYNGAVLHDTIHDESFEIKTMLENNNIPYTLESSGFLIHGYK